MIKKSTLFILLGAIALGAAVYYFDWKRGQKECGEINRGDIEAGLLASGWLRDCLARYHSPASGR